MKEKEDGRGLTLTMHLAEANKIGEERAYCHALDKERMRAETHTIPMGGKRGIHLPSSGRGGAKGSASRRRLCRGGP